MVRALTSTSRGKRAIVAVLLAFALVAGALAYVLVAAPAAAVVRARRWQVTECTVISSGVKRLARDAYELDLTYEWHVGRAFRGSRLDFFRRARQHPQEWTPVLQRLRPGQVVSCYVDPARPEQAIIDRGWNGGVAVPVAILSIVLAAVLALGYVPEAATSARDQGARRLTAPGPAPLRPRTTSRRRLVRALGLAVTCNGVAGLLFAARLLPDWREGRPSWLLTLVVGAFALGGLAQIGRAVRALAAMAGPTVLLTAVPEARLGERLVVEWTIEQRANLVTGLELALVGREIARYPDWDANRQQEQREERAEFFRAALSAERAGESLGGGRAGIDLPRLIPPTLDARSNQIAWTIALHAAVRGRPDLAEEYPIRLRPPGKAL